jgi:hypothetical protein
MTFCFKPGIHEETKYNKQVYCDGTETNHQSTRPPVAIRCQCGNVGLRFVLVEQVRNTQLCEY